MEFLDKYKAEPFSPTPEQRKCVFEAWEDFRLMYKIRTQPLFILGDRTLQTFWDDSVKDYAVWTEPGQDNDPVTQYSSTISRDRADVFIANLTKQLMFPTVTAQNKSQEIDRLMGRISRSLLEWAHNNDGYPSESGHQKLTRYIHKMVVEGTVHIEDNVDTDGLDSKLVPNEEVFIPNYWEPDIQKQGKLIRARINVTWEDAEVLYGSLPNWKYVQPGYNDWWYYQRPAFKEQWQGIIMYDRVQILEKWQNCTQKELSELRKSGRIAKDCKRAKWYNLFINEIPMFPYDTLSPYKDGLYPISKGIFTEFAKSEFYWGNSLPNKCSQDKKWLDGWKTLLRYKGKLNIGRPLQSLNGNFVDEDIIVPFKITPVTEEIELKPIEGVGDPISSADVQMYQMAKGEVMEGTVAPQNQISNSQKATASVIMENNAKIQMDNIALKVAFLIQSRTYPILLRLFQFLPRSAVEKIAVPDQKLRGGNRGTLEVIFKKLPKMTKEEQFNASMQLYKIERQSAKDNNAKEIAYIDPDYVRECNYYLKTDPQSIFQENSEMETQKFNSVFPTLVQLPQMFEATEVARQFVEKNDLPEEMIKEQQQGQSMQPQGQPQQLQQPSMPQGLMQKNAPQLPTQANQQMATQMPQLVQGV